MNERFLHYGKEVLYQHVEKPFTEQLKKNNIAYYELPLVDDYVVSYKYNGYHRYAYMTGDFFSDVYIFAEIPVDMSFKNIDVDYRMQKHSEQPMRLKTKALTLLEYVTKQVDESNVQGMSMDDILTMGIYHEPDYDEIKAYLKFSLGFSVDDILAMDCSDIDPDFLEKLKKAKYFN